MISFPNAKINLGLNILNKRADGFHNIETIFYPVKSLIDILEFVKIQETDNPVISCEVSGINVNSENKDNLCVKAYNILNKDFNLPPVKMHLHKNIPVGAGLGGGSADAAFMLIKLNSYFNLGIKQPVLEEYAAQLGSDCSFFIKNSPCFASGRGEILESVEISLQGLHIVLIYPNLHISTALAYSGVKPAIPQCSLKDIVKEPVQKWKGLMINDFEQSIFNKFPELDDIKQHLYNIGALYSSMSGSGSSIFGIFESRPDNFPDFFSPYFIHTGIL